MFSLQTVRVSGIALTLAAVAFGSANAQVVDTTFTFDNLPTETPANDFVPGSGFDAFGLTFSPAVFAPDLNSDINDPDFGLPIPGTDRWRPDPAPIEPATARVNPVDPVNTSNALDALFQPVLLQFNQPLTLNFSTVLDFDTFGTPGGVSVLFFDANNTLLTEAPLDQFQPGFSVLTTGHSLSGVSSILLPGGAYYDNLRLTTVPEPGSIALLGGLVVLGGLALRRRK